MLTQRVLQGMLMSLPEHELKMALDPAAVSFSATHNRQVLVVEQAVARGAHVSQSPKYKGQSLTGHDMCWSAPLATELHRNASTHVRSPPTVHADPQPLLELFCRGEMLCSVFWRHCAGVLRNLTADEQPVDRCFFWLQDNGASAPSTRGAGHNLLKTAMEPPVSPAGPVTLPKGTDPAALGCPEVHGQQEGKTQLRTTAAHAALMLRRSVQSAAHRNIHSSPASPLLQISGDSQHGICAFIGASPVQARLCWLRILCLLSTPLVQCRSRLSSLNGQIESFPSFRMPAVRRKGATSALGHTQGLLYQAAVGLR